MEDPHVVPKMIQAHGGEVSRRLGGVLTAKADLVAFQEDNAPLLRDDVVEPEAARGEGDDDMKAEGQILFQNADRRPSEMFLGLKSPFPFKLP